MKQVQSGISLARPMGPGFRRAAVGVRPSRARAGLVRSAAGMVWASARGLRAAAAIAWGLITLPLRLAFRLIAWLGRLAGVAIGFSMMVAGMFFLAGPFFLVGIPLFGIGLVLTLRCLD